MKKKGTRCDRLDCCMTQDRSEFIPRVGLLVSWVMFLAPFNTEARPRLPWHEPGYCLGVKGELPWVLFNKVPFSYRQFFSFFHWNSLHPIYGVREISAGLGLRYQLWVSFSLHCVLCHTCFCCNMSSSIFLYGLHWQLLSGNTIWMSAIKPIYIHKSLFLQEFPHPWTSVI